MGVPVPLQCERRGAADRCSSITSRRSINLYETPRWYHGLCTNCTTSFYRLPSTPVRCDWRVIANGRLDRALYEDGRLDRTLPFAELRRLAYLNDIANAAPEDGVRGPHPPRTRKAPP